MQFFEMYKERMPTGTIDALAATIETDTGLGKDQFDPEFAKDFIKKWLVSIISSIHGVHSPLMLVLAGKTQGTGKTEWFRRLLPAELKAYYAESKLDRDKDDEILMTKKLIIMNDEMGGATQKDEKRIKELTSKDVFSLREPYGKGNVDLKRLAALCGTTNSESILSDPTGNRRILPIRVLNIDHEKYNAIDKVDLFMEAYWLYKSGFNWEVKKEDLARLNDNTDEFEKASVERELLLEYYEFVNENDQGAEFMTTTMIKSVIETRSGLRTSSTRLGLELNKLSARKTKRINGTPQRGFWIREARKSVVMLTPVVLPTF
jgi:predicted P-loop ATPase